MSFKHSQFIVAQRFEAELALEGMSDKDRVHFALKLMLDVKDPNAAGSLSFAARQMGGHAKALSSECEAG